MIVQATAIPLAIYPWSSTSRIVHWLTHHQGKVSTLLKGALRPKSPFLGEYELFSTSELLYFAKPAKTLYTGKECALLHRRETFRTNWRAMQTASYITSLFNRTTPEEAHQPELFVLCEELLDLAEEYGQHPQYLLWAEFRFCEYHGHAPSLGHCVLCASDKELRFCAGQGGVVCMQCARARKLPILECPPDVLAILRAWQKARQPGPVVNTRLTARQLTALNAIAGTFMMYHFHLHPEYRNAALAAA
ncbi:MAG: DNA repair protein RecO [Kiritimatiellales bacterium]|nr:DNA repair protein RecO [Kiritimatiellales bacterium]